MCSVVSKVSQFEVPLYCVTPAQTHWHVATRASFEVMFYVKKSNECKCVTISYFVRILIIVSQYHYVHIFIFIFKKK